MDVMHAYEDTNAIRAWMGSQCSCFSVGGIWSLGLRYFIRRAAVYCRLLGRQARADRGISVRALFCPGAPWCGAATAQTAKI